MNTEILTKQQCSAIRAFAILGIILHNYIHWLPSIVRENEFTYSIEKNTQLLEVIKNYNELLPLHLLSYFGHYGVVLFIFLSGFGLVMKYEKSDLSEISILNFIRYNYLKLFRIFIVGFTAFVIVDAMTPQTHHYLFPHIIGMFSMFANLLDIPHSIYYLLDKPHRSIWPGPYWYFGVILQLYIIYRLFMYRKNNLFIPFMLVLISFILQIYYENNEEILKYFRYNFIGWILPFVGGVLCGRYIKNVQLNQFIWFFMFLISSVMIFILCFAFIGWLLIPIFIVISTIAFIKVLSKQTITYLSWIGSLSATIFVIHPLVRKLFIHQYTYHVYSGLLLYVVISISLSYFIQNIIINKIPNPKL